MFQLLVALALFAAISPIRPALSLSDLSPDAGAEPQRRLEVAAVDPAAAARLQGPVRKDPARLGIETNSRAVAVVDWGSGQSLFGKNADEPLPIASITKLMSALVVLDRRPDWDSLVAYRQEDDRPGDLPLLFPGDQVTVRDLFSLSLVASSNDATVAMARSTGLSPEEFAAEMNRLGREIGLSGHRFTEPTGLDVGNVATASDVARLLKRALAEEPIRQAVLSGTYEFRTAAGTARRAGNTDQLLGSFLTRPPYTFYGGKTGYISQAGYCFGAMASNESGNRVIAVVLGAGTRDERFSEVKRLLWWAFDAWSWER